MRAKAVAQSIALCGVVLSFVGCNEHDASSALAPTPIPSPAPAPAPTPPPVISPANVEGVWIFQDSTTTSSRTDTWTLIQRGNDVSGTTLGVNPAFTYRGTITGAVNENRFKFEWIIPQSLPDGTPCGPTRATGTMTVSGDSMSGRITDSPGCGGRIGITDHTLIRQPR
jgi:hypothetical protein